MKNMLILCLLLATVGCQQPLERVPLKSPAFDAVTLQKLRAARLINGDEILAERALASAAGTSWITDDPYRPKAILSEAECAQSPNCSYARERFYSPLPQFPAESKVYAWWTQRQTDALTAEVCGVRFEDESRTQYRLKTFSSLSALEQTEGFRLTHFHACGTCSSLQDLAVYGELDLTVMGKTCSKRRTPDDKKACMRAIGFTEACAETWAWNATQTAQSCALTCVATYGLLPLLKGTENVPPVDAAGNLNPCVLCDEVMSGPGFQYAAGRTRRDSGILSEIARPEEQVYSVPHDYFR